jgi:ABC-type Mn2+/Zn2+ transport system permease subunit
MNWSAVGDLWASALLRRSTLLCIVVGATCGAIGVHIVLRRLTFFVASVGHVALPGMVVAAALGVPVQAGAAIATTGAAQVTRRGSTELTGVVVAGAIGLGVLIQSLDSSPRRDLASLLTGSVLSVSAVELLVSAAAATAALAWTTVHHHELVAGAFDRELVTGRGARPGLDGSIAVVAGLLAVVALPVVGSLLVLALTVVPASAALMLTRRVPMAMAAGALLGAASGVVGLAASLVADVAAGAAIALAAGLCFVGASAVRWRRERRSRLSPLRPTSAPALMP